MTNSQTKSQYSTLSLQVPEATTVRDSLVKERQKRADCNKLAHFKPYAKQLEFYGEGNVHRERLLMAANQCGKTYCGAFEAAMHLTGRYAEWWPGRRFEVPVRGWAASVTAEATRDTVQRTLIGDPRSRETWGTGAIPKDMLGDITRRQGVANALDGVQVKHISGGMSSIGFKSYDQGREKWQGETLDFVWFDEEPPVEIYTEGLTRTNATGGFVWMTFTPLLGMSEVVRMFLDDERNNDPVLRLTQ